MKIWIPPNPSLKSCKCPTSFAESGLNVLFRPIVCADKASQVCKVLDIVKWFTVDSNGCWVDGVYADDLCLSGTDVKTCLLCILVQSVNFLL